MPRYSLRNQHKIKANYGQKILNRIIENLDYWFGNNCSIEEHEHEPYNLISIGDNGHTDGIIVFHVIRKTFDCYNLAFKEFIN